MKGGDRLTFLEKSLVRLSIVLQFHEEYTTRYKSRPTAKEAALALSLTHMQLLGFNHTFWIKFAGMKTKYRFSKAPFSNADIKQIESYLPAETFNYFLRNTCVHYLKSIYNQNSDILTIPFFINPLNTLKKLLLLISERLTTNLQRSRVQNDRVVSLLINVMI